MTRSDQICGPIFENTSHHEVIRMDFLSQLAKANAVRARQTSFVLAWHPRWGLGARTAMQVEQKRLLAVACMVDERWQRDASR